MFPRRSKDQKSTPVNVSTYSTQRRDKEKKMKMRTTYPAAQHDKNINDMTRKPRRTICTRRAGKLYKARSRLYRCQILQVNTRWKALAEIYAIHSFAPFLETIFEKPGQKEPGQNTPLKRLHRFGTHNRKLREKEPGQNNLEYHF